MSKNKVESYSDGRVSEVFEQYLPESVIGNLVRITFNGKLKCKCLHMHAFSYL
jgi:hypothetical protein